MKSVLTRKMVITVLLCIPSFAVFSQLSPLTISKLSPGDSIVIYYDVTINAPCGCSQVSNQGTITGANFTTFNTDDPNTVAAGDPTITLLNMFPLPVTLTQISARKEGSGIRVSWLVTAESNIWKYEVEQSTDGINFRKIGELSSLNLSVEHTYSYLDLNPNRGENYYRVRVIEVSTQVLYTKIVHINTSQDDHEIKIYPNPVVNRQINLQLVNLDRGNYNFTLVDNTGRIVFMTAIRHEGGSLNRILNLPTNILPGLYVAHIAGDKEGFNRLLIIK